jgi:hypothetical protein
MLPVSDRGALFLVPSVGLPSTTPPPQRYELKTGRRWFTPIFSCGSGELKMFGDWLHVPRIATFFDGPRRPL